MCASSAVMANEDAECALYGLSRGRG